MLDIASSVLELAALLARINQRWLKLPTTIGVMATSLALLGLDGAGLAWPWACTRARPRWCSPSTSPSC